MASVLIIDDEYGLTEMAGELLVMSGYEVATAVNGKLGLAALTTMRPDVILLDVMMPIVSGLDVLRAIKSDPEYRTIPVIMMSAAGPESVPDDMHYLVAGFVTNPFTFDELLAALMKILPVH